MRVISQAKIVSCLDFWLDLQNHFYYLLLLLAYINRGPSIIIFKRKKLKK